MGFSPLVLVGEYILFAAQLIAGLSWYVYLGIVVVVAATVIARYLSETLHLNPFSRVVYHLTRPASILLANMRNSRFYYPLRRALKFDPAVLMLLIGTAIACYAISIVVAYFLGLMSGAGRALIALGDGYVFTAIRLLVGTVLLGVIFYLLTLMLLVFVNWIFGLFARAARRAFQRLGPLLHLFEFGGAFAGWSFLILGIALSFAAAAVQMIFLS
ncbi:MAG: hypothetical protein ABI882_04160 [Acidobacteriota bacterium]